MPTDKQNSSWLSFQFIITLVFSLVTLKLNINHFGEKSFGIWIVLASIWGFGSTLDFGFGTAIVKYVAEFKEDRIKISKLLSSSFFVFLVNGFAILILGEVAGFLIYFGSGEIIQPASKSLYTIVFIILGLSFSLQYISLFFKSIVEGLSNFIFTSKLTIIQNAIILLGTIIISLTKLNIIALSILYFLTYLIILSSYMFYFYDRIKDYSITTRLFNIKEVKKILGFSLSVQGMTVFNALIDPIVKYMLSAYLNINFVPAYEIARRFAIAISGLFFNTFKIVLPKASILKSKKEIKEFILNDLIKYSKIGITYSGLAFGILSLPIVFMIHSIFGIREAILIFIILSLPESINNFGYAIYNFLLGIGKVYLLVIVQFNNLIFVIVGLFIGFNLFHNLLGLLGYFLSVIIGNILMVVFLRREWGISLSKFFIKCKIYKLGILIVLVGIVISLIYKNTFSVYVDFTLLTLFSCVVFGRDVHHYIKIAKGSISLRFSK